MDSGGSEEQQWLEAHRVRRAVMVVDLVESVRLMQQHEDAVIARWRRFVREVRDEVLPAHGGRMVKSLGDGMLVEFEAVRPSIACAFAVQACMARLNAAGPQPPNLPLRIGLHADDVVVDEVDIYGSAVNLAARLAGLAGPDEVVCSVAVADQLVSGLDARFEDLGDCYLKHVDRAVRAYRLHPPASDDAAPVVIVDTRPGGDTALQAPLRTKLAVLNFDGEPGSRVLCSLLADELGVQLAAHTSLDVISRMSTRHADGVDAPALLLRLGANYAVAGSCAELSGQVRVSVELVHVPDQRVIWSGALTAALATLIQEPASVLAQVGADVMAAVEAHETGRARSLPLASLDSYALMVGGLRLMHRLSRMDFDRARDVFEALVARHPRHPDGFAWLAKWHILQLHQGWSPDPARSMGMAHELARRALEHDDRCAVALTVAGMSRTFADRRLDQAEAIYAQALQHHPNDALAWLLKSTVHAFRGEGDAATAHARRARQLSPLDPMAYYFDSLSASAEASAGHYDEAVMLARRSLAANAMHASTLRILAIAHAMQDQLPEARQAVDRLLALEPDFTVARFLARSPSADYDIGKRYAQALRRAGVPD